LVECFLCQNMMWKHHRTVPFWKGSIMIYPRFAQIRTCLGWKNENH
jgi:hypothetical protein